MRRLLLGLIVCSSLLVPRVSAASVIFVGGSDQDGFFSFGLSGLDVSGTFEEIFVNGTGFQATGSFQILSPLKSLVVTNGNSRYVFGPGSLVIDADFELPNGTQKQGSFNATLLEFEIELCEQQLQAPGDDCNDPFGESIGTAFASLGQGVFDYWLAKFLGVGTSSSSGSYQPPTIDGVTGDPGDNTRLAGYESGRVGDIEVESTVPEPSGTLLLLMSMAGVMRARRAA